MFSITQKPQNDNKNDYDVLFATQQFPFIPQSSFPVVIYKWKKTALLGESTWAAFPFNHYEQWGN